MNAASMEPPVFFSCDWCSVKCPSAFNLHQVSFLSESLFFQKTNQLKSMQFKLVTDAAFDPFQLSRPKSQKSRS